MVIVGGAVAYTAINDDGSEDSSGDEIVNKVRTAVPSSEPSQATDEASDEGDDGIVSEEVKYNYQNDDGSYYREVTYEDGGFRQYETESGELIGSSYDSDQDQLPSME